MVFMAVCVALARGAAYVIMYGRDRITLGATAVTFCLSVIFLCIFVRRE
jgi:hypothetical protein